MNQIDKMIQELCPEGVEVRKLGEVAEVSRGVRVVRSQLGETGAFPVYQNSLTPLGYYDKCNCQANTTFIIGAGAAGKIGFSTVNFWAADDCYIIMCKPQLDSKYIYHAMLNRQIYFDSKVRKASIPRLSRTFVEDFKVPLPPLPIQRRIVEILDKFTELEAELEAELDCRKRQYEYYRNQLLTFANGGVRKA